MMSSAKMCAQLERETQNSSLELALHIDAHDYAATVVRFLIIKTSPSPRLPIPNYLHPHSAKLPLSAPICPTQRQIAPPSAKLPPAAPNCPQRLLCLAEINQNGRKWSTIA